MGDGQAFSRCHHGSRLNNKNSQSSSPILSILIRISLYSKTCSVHQLTAYCCIVSNRGVTIVVFAHHYCCVRRCVVCHPRGTCNCKQFFINKRRPNMNGRLVKLIHQRFTSRAVPDGPRPAARYLFRALIIGENDPSLISNTVRRTAAKTSLTGKHFVLAMRTKIVLLNGTVTCFKARLNFSFLTAVLLRLLTFFFQSFFLSLNFFGV